MEIVNRSGMTFGMITGRVYFPGHSLTLVAKGTWDLVRGGTAVPSEEQLLPTGPEPWDDGGDSPSLRYDSDFAHYKPRADLLVVGTARPPGGQPVTRLPVGVRVGQHSKALMVFGDRWWTTGAVRSEATDPVPFDQMPLRYENAFGGAGFAWNPVGKGYGEVVSEAGYSVLPLPNVEHPSDRLESPDAVPYPAGFAPIPVEWRERMAKTGTYDDRWLAERWPWFPEDLDWTFFNSAPPDMQVEGFLRGDEEIQLENLDAEHPHFTSRLPGVRVRCFLSENDEPGGASGGEAERVASFREVPMSLDTLWIDADARTLVLVWRGVAEVSSEELDEIRHVLLVAQGPGDEARSLEDHRRELEEHLAAEAAEMEGVDLDALPQGRDEPEPPDEDLEVAASIEGMNEELAAAGLPTVKFPEDDVVPPAEPEAGDDDEPDVRRGPMSREDVAARLAAGETLEEQDLSGTDLEGMDLSGVGLAGAILTGTVLRDARLDGADLAGAILAGAVLAGASLREATLTEADLTGADVSRADLTGADLGGATLEGARLPGARLDDARAVDAILIAADLGGATATGAVLSGADLTGCSLREADFRGADLREACLEGADATSADFSSCALGEFQAGEGADFTGARFREADAPESIWTGSLLTRADLALVNAEGGDFEGADLAGANLAGANLKSARFVKADLTGARLVECNLFEASLEKADLHNADLLGANLYGAELLGARFDGARLDGANLTMTKLDPR